MTAAIYLHVKDLREMTEVICYPAIALREITAVIGLHASDL